MTCELLGVGSTPSSQCVSPPLLLCPRPPLSLGSAAPSAWGPHWPSGRARLHPQPTCSTPQPRRAFLMGPRLSSGPVGMRSLGPPGASAGAASPRSRHDAPLRLPLPTLVGMLTPRPPRVSPWLGALVLPVSVGLVPLPPPGLCQLGLLLPSC